MIELAERVRALLGPRAVAELEWRGRKEPLPMVLPASIEEIQELVRWAAKGRVRVAPVGLGSKLGWTRPPQGEVLALTTRRLQHVIEYEPGEGVITALAGTRLSSLRELTRAQGHWLTPDVPAAESATLGGVIAAGQSGLDRLRYGPVRHHVLGVNAVLADGSLARTGGRLVKNVTGFDLQRLYCGSQGTLCIVVEATLRLFAAPRRESVLSARAPDADAMLALARALERLPVRPIALLATRAPSPPSNGEWTLTLHLGGLAESVQAEIEQLGPAWTPCGPGAAAELREQACETRPEPWFRITCPALRLERALELDFAHASWSTRKLVQPAVGILDVQLAPRDGQKITSEALAAVATREQARAREMLGPGASFELRNPTRRTAGLVEPLAGVSAAALRRMRALRQALDPEGLFVAAGLEALP